MNGQVAEFLFEGLFGNEGGRERREDPLQLLIEIVESYNSPGNVVAHLNGVATAEQGLGHGRDIPILVVETHERFYTRLDLLL
ncbi:MAG: hypothetical protein EBX37_13135 [Alphaproteobacteria bacterium]|nr:hypothetical protein [Alphaproteobacteria bacterium]